MHIRIGTRGSALALWQAEYVSKQLQTIYPYAQIELRIITTRGDREQDTPLPAIGGKGLFTLELEEALHNGEIDCAVHSLKDLPTKHPAGLTIGAVLERGAVGDVLISRYTLDTLPQGAIIGTSSRRRAAQLLHLRPDFEIRNIRGNVPTRIQKAKDYDAIVLAEAGLERLNLMEYVSERLSLDIMLNAPGQGVLAVQCTDANREMFAPLQHHPTLLAATAERAFLAALEGGCAVPVAAYAVLEGDGLSLHGRVNSVDGVHQIDVLGRIEAADVEKARELGIQLAQNALQQGADALLQEIRDAQDQTNDQNLD